MSSNKRNLSLLAILALLGAAGTAEAQAPLGTRAAGMAGAFVGVADDASAVYWNPAGLATGAIVSAIVSFSERSKPRRTIRKRLQANDIRVQWWRSRSLQLASPTTGLAPTARRRHTCSNGPPEPRRSAAQCARAHDFYGRRVATAVIDRTHCCRRDAESRPRVGGSGRVDAMRGGRRAGRRGRARRVWQHDVRRRCRRDGRGAAHQARAGGAQPDDAVVRRRCGGRGRRDRAGA